MLSVSNTTTTTLEDLRKEYGKLRETRENYGNANLIFDLNDADSTYLKLRISEEKAFLELKRAEVSEFRFNRYFAPVINYRIQNLENRLSNLQFKNRRGASA